MHSLLNLLKNEAPLMKLNFAHLGILLSLFIFSGCTTSPSHLIVAPTIFVTPAIVHNKQIQLNVVDMRTATHIVQVSREGEAATLISAQQRLENTIKNELSQHWNKQSLAINNHATNVVTVNIEQALISVSQETMSYKVQTEIMLKVIVNNGEKTLTSTFKNNGNSHGPWRADIAVLERNFNERLAKLLQQILANEKISHFLI